MMSFMSFWLPAMIWGAAWCLALFAGLLVLDGSGLPRTWREGLGRSLVPLTLTALVFTTEGNLGSLAVSLTSFALFAYGFVEKHPLRTH